MAVSPEARRHFALIGEAMAEKARDQRRKVLRTTMRERVEVGLALGCVPRTAAIQRTLDELAEGQIGLARRRPRR